MRQRLASLFLLLVLCGGAFAGVPLGFGENQCSMSGMGNMQCCKAMLRRKKAKVSAAQLLCAIACAKSGSTLPSSSVRVTPPAVARTIEPPPAVNSAAIISLRFQRLDRLHDPPGSPPKYLRNLALLI